MLIFIVAALMHVLWRFGIYRRFDVINTHFALPDGILGVIASRMLGIPNLLTIIGGDIYDPTKKSSPHRAAWTRMINGFVMNAAEQIVAVSSDTKRNAQRFYRVKKEITVINYGFLPPRRDPEAISLVKRGSYALIAIGRLVERKGFEFLIRALAKLPEDIVLYIIGDGPMEASLKTLGNDIGLNGRLRILGYVPREEVYAYLRSADCFVLSSLHEGLGIVVQEAMYSGLPIVSTTNGGQVDLIKNYRNGILVDPGKVEPLADAICELYNNPKLARNMADNNRRDIEEYFMSVNAGRYISLFESLIANCPATRDVKQVLPAQSRSELD
jgi:glycosyltransferase involved in cell wall biosynthesis